MARQHGLPAGDGEATLRPPTQAQLLLELAGDADLVHTADCVAYASLNINGHRETHRIRGGGFRRWLVAQFYAKHGKPPNAQALNSALEYLEAEACQCGPEEIVWVRTAAGGNAVYVDLADASWQAVEITAAGWRLVALPPTRFRRAPGMTALPVPVAGGCIEALRRFVNIADDRDFVLLVACILANLRPLGPYPVLCLQGEQGSAKSTAARVARALVDPSTAPLRTMPRDERDLMIAAHNSWVLAFDNVSRLPPWLSDAICRLATGGGLSTRQLYTDAEETLFAGQRPVILNGIEDLLERDDLRDRAVALTLPPITDCARRDEERFWKGFGDAQPMVLGVLLDAVSAALRTLPKIEIEELPRMADFARWVTAAETALGWSAGVFLAAYRENGRDATAAFLESDAIAVAVTELVVGANGMFEGTLKELLAALNARCGAGNLLGRRPLNERGLSGRLRRTAPALRRAGTIVEFMPRTNRGKIVRISRGPHVTVTTVTTVTPAQATVTAAGAYWPRRDGGDAGDGPYPPLRTPDGLDAGLNPPILRLEEAGAPHPERVAAEAAGERLVEPCAHRGGPIDAWLRDDRS